MSVKKVLSEKNCRKILILMKTHKVSKRIIEQYLQIDDATIYLKMLIESELIIEFNVQEFTFYELNLSVIEEIMLYFQHKRGGLNEN